MLAGTPKAAVALLVVVVVGSALGALVFDDRVESAHRSTRAVSVVRIDAQHLHVIALKVALHVDAALQKRRPLRRYRGDVAATLRALRASERPSELQTLRNQSSRFAANYSAEIALVEHGASAAEITAALARLTHSFELADNTLGHVAGRADARYGSASRARDVSLLVFVVAALASLLALDRRTRIARREQAQSLRRENARLLELDRMKEEFVASVSHELRTPLTSIRGYLELVADGEAGPVNEQQVEFLAVAERNADRLLALVEDLLESAQAQTGRLVLERRHADLNELVAHSVVAIQPRADAAGVELQTDLTPVPQIAIDAKRVGQVVDNLLSNAVKFTPRGGSIDIRLGRKNGHVELEISDSGIGISESEQARLFELFFRTQAASEAAIPGTGLGLSISKAIVEAHAGSIAVSSLEGAGTTFTVRLPVAE